MRFYAVLLFAFVVSNLWAQECNNILMGEIVDFHDNSQLQSATITIIGQQLTATSNANGKFRFEGICDGVYELEVSHPECTSRFVPVTVHGDTYQKISLEHHLEELQEVKVVGDLAKTTKTGQEERLTAADLEKYSGNSLGDALKKINGVSSLNTGANIVKPVIQGLNGSRVLVLNNNVRMQDMEWGDEHAPNVDLNANQKISVIKGAAALKYGGDAIGGVIILDPLPIARTDSLFGKTQVNLFSNGRGGNITTTLVKSYESGLYLKAQGSYKRLGDLEAPDYLLSNTGIRETGVSFNIGKRGFIEGWEGYYSYFDSDIGILRASHIGNVDDLIESINSQRPIVVNPFSYDIIRPNQEVAHHLGKMNYYRRFEGLGKASVQYDFQNNRRFEYDIRVGDDANKPSLDLKLTTHTVSADFKFDSRQNINVQLGAIGRFQSNFANPDTGVRRLIPDYDKYDLGIFAVSELNFGDDWLVEGGIRYDFTSMNAKKFYRTSRWEERGYQEDFGNFIIEDIGTQLLTNPKFDYHNVSATMGFKYEFANDHRVRLNYTFAQRAPNPSELFSDGLHHSAARIELGDIRIKSESSSKVSASYERNTAKWGYTVAPYLNSISDFILLEPNGVEFTLRGAFPVWSYRQTNALLLGVDVSAFHNWGAKIRSDHKFSWVQGTDKSKKTALINMPPARLLNSISYVNPKLNNLSISLESNYVFEQKRTPPNISVFSPRQQEEVLLDINTAPPAYHLISIDAKTRFSIRNTNDFGIGLRLSNVLNTDYRNYLNRQRYFVDDQGRNISLRLIYNY